MDCLMFLGKRWKREIVLRVSVTWKDRRDESLVLRENVVEFCSRYVLKLSYRCVNIKYDNDLSILYAIRQY